MAEGSVRALRSHQRVLRPRGSRVWIPEVACYGWSLAVFDGREAIAAYCAKLEGGRRDYHVVPPDHFGRFVPNPDHRAFAIWLEDGASPGTLVHELTHLVIYLFDRIDLVMEHRSSEAATYLIRHLFDAIFDELYTGTKWAKRSDRRTGSCRCGVAVGRERGRFRKRCARDWTGSSYRDAGIPFTA
jgi:hypothetical protein